MTTSRRTADILIQSPEGNPIAVVEVKNIPNLTRDEAVQLRRNLADYGVPFQTPFFLLLSQDIGFLWKDSKYENLDSQPTYEFPMDRVVARYSVSRVRQVPVRAVAACELPEVWHHTKARHPQVVFDLCGTLQRVIEIFQE